MLNMKVAAFIIDSVFFILSVAPSQKPPTKAIEVHKMFITVNQNILSKIGAYGTNCLGRLPWARLKCNVFCPDIALTKKPRTT